MEHPIRTSRAVLGFLSGGKGTVADAGVAQQVASGWQPCAGGWVPLYSA
ncbi:MAG: hypothetical protein HQL74_09950 [Magnetococcales bacterium]|nr:hypothetical protein [Magnetococcales bacterium]